MKRSALLTSVAVWVSLSAIADHRSNLSGTDWSEIRKVHEAASHRFISTEGGGHWARQPGMDWWMEFDGAGFTVRPRHGAWIWGLELEGVGKNGRSIQATGRKLTVKHSTELEEWFINDARGLEQGWTLKKRVPIVLRVRGSLQPSVAAQCVDFGGCVSYSGLKAWDARGRIVPVHFEARQTGFEVRYDDSDALYPITIDPLAQNAYLKPGNPGAYQGFGTSIAVSGDTVVVGAPFEDSAATGVNSDPGTITDEAFNAGAAYVFTRNGGVWRQQAYLKSSNPATEAQFGSSVAISGDTVLVGAQREGGHGVAYVFVRSGSIWTQQALLQASNAGAIDQFGVSVGLSGDTAVVGAYNEDGSASVINGPSDDAASQSGAAYVFVRKGTTWTQQAYLKASNTGLGDLFGQSVAVSADTVVVGAPGEKSGIVGDPADNSLPYAGAAYVFLRAGGIWSQQAYLKAVNPGLLDQFGSAVGIDGDTLIVGSPYEDSGGSGVNSTPDEGAADSGAAYVFARSAGAWTQQAFLKASNTGGWRRFWRCRHDFGRLACGRGGG